MVTADLLDVQVPNLVLQPLVENAIVHGVGPRPGPGHVTLRVRRDGDTLSLCVLDTLRQAQGGGCVAEVRLPLEPALAV